MGKAPCPKGMGIWAKGIPSGGPVGLVRVCWTPPIVWPNLAKRLWQMGTGVVALEHEKVLPNVDFFSLAPAVDGTKVDLNVEVFHLLLAFQMERISSFSSFRSTSVALKSSNKLRHRASLNTPCTTSQSRSTVKALALTKLHTVGLPLLRTWVTTPCKILWASAST